MGSTLFCVRLLVFVCLLVCVCLCVCLFVQSNKKMVRFFTLGVGVVVGAYLAQQHEQYVPDVKEKGKEIHEKLKTVDYAKYKEKMSDAYQTAKTKTAGGSCAPKPPKCCPACGRRMD